MVLYLEVVVRDLVILKHKLQVLITIYKIKELKEVNQLKDLLLLNRDH